MATLENSATTENYNAPTRTALIVPTRNYIQVIDLNVLIAHNRQITRYDPLDFHVTSNARRYTLTVACLSISIIRRTRLMSIDLPAYVYQAHIPRLCSRDGR